MKGREIRERFLRFFEERGHKRLPSASLVPENDPTLLFTVAGMVPFKPMFLGKGDLSWKRVCTSQKCLRVPDLEKVGTTPRHHTFFEMLGNFSFGDYFKRECIPWEWEFFTKECGLSPDALVVSVYEEDDEAAGIWQEVVGVPPERIYRFGDAENFWPAEARGKGPNGPCGPCSEIYFDARPKDALPPTRGLEALPEDRFTEIGNCVFIQFERRDPPRAGALGDLVPLPKKNIDVGLGLERIAAVLQGVSTNFDTDLFRPLVEAIAGRARRKYGKEPATDVRIRRIADHARAATFAISDGVLPSNEERGYVVRKIVRRAARDGVDLGIGEPFLHELPAVLAASMGNAYPELVQHRSTVEAVIRTEEEKFRDVYRRGRQFLDERLAKVEAEGRKAFPGADAFELHDTFGFPVDFTREIAAEAGLPLDEAGFEKAMEDQRRRAREGSGMKGERFAGGPADSLKAAGHPRTRFVAYGESWEGGYSGRVEGKLLAAFRAEKSVEEVREGEEADLVFDRTPFYAESGGQVGDQGWVRSGKKGPGAEARVVDVQNRDGFSFHRAKVSRGRLLVGGGHDLEVDPEWRWRVAKNHTATHLLHQALKDVLGPSVNQAGSLVHPEYLRFDFTWGKKLTDEEIRAVEDLVNRKVMEAIPVTWAVKPIDAAQAEGACMLFGEKYGERVRVLTVGGYSKELCGGTHVVNTGNIGLFRITKETALGAGVRRLFALTGPGAIEDLRRAHAVLGETAEKLRVPAEKVPERVDSLLRDLKDARRAKPAASATSGSSISWGPPAIVGGAKLAWGRWEGADVGALRSAAAKELGKMGPTGVVALFGGGEGSVPFVVAAGEEAVRSGFSAGEAARQAGECLGGGGGGKPALGQGEGKDASRFEEAVGAIRSLLAASPSGAVDSRKGHT